MKTIWFVGNNEERLTSIAEIVGEELINREQNVELIVHSEVQDILGIELKNKGDEGRAIFTDRLGFLGHLLHKNNTFALIVSCDSTVEDRKIVKENYKNYLQINLSEKDELADVLLETKNDPKSNTKKIMDYLINQKIVPEECTTIYSKEEEEEIRRRLEELGYV